MGDFTGCVDRTSLSTARIDVPLVWTKYVKLKAMTTSGQKLQQKMQICTNGHTMTEADEKSRKEGGSHLGSQVAVQSG